MTERILRVLEALKGPGGSVTASEIARRTGIPVPSAHRIVTELVDLGLLDRDSDRGVRIGMRLWEIATRSSGVPTLREIALPYMEDLRAVTHSPLLLSVLDGNDVLNVETLSSRQPCTTNVTRPGVRLPALASSPGLILVAFAPPEAREGILGSAKVTRFTECTVVDRGELARIVHEARRVGYVVLRRWLSSDSTGVAVPILAHDGTALAALSVTLPFDEGEPSELLAALRTTARGISRAFHADDSRFSDPRLALLRRRLLHSVERP